MEWFPFAVISRYSAFHGGLWTVPSKYHFLIKKKMPAVFRIVSYLLLTSRDSVPISERLVFLSFQTKWSLTRCLAYDSIWNPYADRNLWQPPGKRTSFICCECFPLGASSYKCFAIVLYMARLVLHEIWLPALVCMSSIRWRPIIELKYWRGDVTVD